MLKEITPVIYRFFPTAPWGGITADTVRRFFGWIVRDGRICGSCPPRPSRLAFGPNAGKCPAID
jgi:hypothetical protein